MLTVVHLPYLDLTSEIFGKITLFRFLREMSHDAEKEPNIPESKS
jgi:hypothetical protein